MDTDIMSGVQAGLRTVLVMSGSTKKNEVDRYPYRPTYVRKSIKEVVPMIAELG